MATINAMVNEPFLVIVILFIVLIPIFWFLLHLLNTPEAQLAKTKFINKYSNDSDRVVFRKVVIQRLGKQHALVAVFTFDETPHDGLSPS
jgi:hypothetical protein